MSLVVLDVLKDKSTQYGEFRDWRYPDAPVTGGEFGQSERLRGSLWSQGHRRSPDGVYRSGGPFFTTKFHTTQEATPANIYRGGSYVAYSGRFHTNASWIHDFTYMNMWGNDTDTINSRAFAYGAQALAKLRPDRPDFAPLVSLAELLREVPDMFEDFKLFNKRYQAELRRLSQRGIFLSRLGKWHLALNFGFLPILSDIRAWSIAHHNANKRALQLVRDNGKWVHRSAHLSAKPGEELTVGWTNSYASANNPELKPVLVTQCYGGPRAKTENYYRKYVNVWCSGKSRYWLPENIIQHHDKLKILRRRLQADLTITPEALYNLVPWSWLLDYFTSFGSFFAALSGGIADHLTFQYAYIMREDYHYDKSVFTQGVYTDRTVTGPVTCTVIREGVLKTRVSASIFGFGLLETGLSPRQAGILGALGLSRL